MASLIITIFNEEKAIQVFLQSILQQKKQPDEVIIVDGGSTDNTQRIVREFIKSNKSKIKFNFSVMRGNRSKGRNEAIKKAKGDVILITDAGCILDKDWVKNISKPFEDREVEVVAGYYDAKPKTIFQKCLVPYVLVMPDKVDPETFLPSTRSMAIRKKVFMEMGGFDERYSHNEDYVFAIKLKAAGKKIVFAKNAIVYWIPRNTFREAYTMFRRFAYGDMEAGITRDKILLIFARYLLFYYFLLYFMLSKSLILIAVIVVGAISYIAYSIYKNMRYVQDLKGLYILPLMQIVSDIAVIHGSLAGLIKRLRSGIKISHFKNNRVLLSIITLYLLVVIPLVRWGIPNTSHPFFYQMDEWHGMQSIRYLFSTGSSNVEGAAYGLLFFYFISGLFLIPFTLVRYLNPFAIKATVGSLEMQERVASVLRISTILWGVGSIILVAKIIRTQIKGNVFLPLLLFTVNPIWLTLSTYFKYDIAVVFWILLSIFFFFRYEENPSPRNLIISSIVSALTVTVKISALPILGMFVLSFLLFTPQLLTRLKLFGVSILVFLTVVLVFGTPDIRTHSIDYYNLLHLNIVTIAGGSHYNITYDPRAYLIFEQYPAIFGHFLYILSVVSFIGLFFLIVIHYIKKRLLLKKEILIVAGTIFYIASLITLKELGAGGNRALILLPFMVLAIALFLKHIQKSVLVKSRKVMITIFILGMILQSAQSFAWMSIKYQIDPRISTSKWMIHNLPKKISIGIENIPIYQLLPDVVVKEFYDLHSSNNFNYEVIDARTPKLPRVIIISGAESANTALKKSPKIDLIKRLNNEGYKSIKSFSVNFYFYDLLESRREFILANLIPMPTTITLYKQ